MAIDEKGIDEQYHRPCAYYKELLPLPTRWDGSFGNTAVVAASTRSGEPHRLYFQKYRHVKRILNFIKT